VNTEATLRFLAGDANNVSLVVLAELPISKGHLLAVNMPQFADWLSALCYKSLVAEIETCRRATLHVIHAK